MSFSESLSIQILADSSQFQGELDEVLGRLESLNEQLNRLGQSGAAVSRLGSQFRSLMSPLAQVSSRLGQVASQVRQLSGMSVSIDVSPAMQALGQLSAMIARVAAQLASLSGGGGGGVGVPPVGGGTNPGGGGVQGNGGGGGGSSRVSNGGRGYSSGGMVTGRSGIDRVPAWLTAGEFVLQQSAVAEIGIGRLDDLNQGRTAKAELPARKSGGEGEQTVNQFGEISIHVSQPVDLNELVRDLEFAGHRLRNRRG
ncbi:hypothetical protein [Rubinisphaera margarita]|uniref:hypothetical protein n=1 Tax=Rubinisphaera margarita TaxID=2909586 RepID=UPI001EE96D24|nr:hypothetical protein [Rubinisphaera margarita]MCG6154901.1 hypothetical protein [Rubinisphaera margarita]